MTEMQWFGESWDAPINDLKEVDVPVGQMCLHCLFDIEAGDRGVIMTAVDRHGERRRPMHLECLIRSTLGGAMADEVIQQLIFRLKSRGQSTADLERAL